MRRLRFSENPALSGGEDSEQAVPSQPPKRSEADFQVTRLRITFRKEGTARLLSHLEITEALIRAIKRSGETFVFSEGFHPHPKISFAFATAVGMESEAEYADIQLRNFSSEPAALTGAINTALPAGLEVTGMKEILPGTPSLSAGIRGFIYEITLPERLAAQVEWSRAQQKADEFQLASSFPLVRETKDKTVVRDIRSLVEELELSPESGMVRVRLLYGQEGSIKPSEILTEVLDFDRDIVPLMRIRKVKTLFAA